MRFCPGPTAATLKPGHLAAQRAAMSETLQALFFTDGDTANAVIDALVRGTGTVNFFCIMHSLFASNICTTEIDIDLCLPYRRPGPGPRCCCVLPVRLNKSQAIDFLWYQKPLTPQCVHTSLIRSRVDTIYQPILDALSCKQTGGGAPLPDVIAQLKWEYDNVCQALRRMFRMSTSPFWFVNAFGTTESELVLVSCAVMFRNFTCTVQTLTHLAWLFDPTPSSSMMSINSYEELSFMFFNSKYRPRVPEFFKYVTKKLTQDSFESAKVDETINTFRGNLLLSNVEIIQYVYLAFFQCFNYCAFSAYSSSTSGANINKNTITHLADAIDEPFKARMHSYYNKCSFLENHISVKKLSGVPLSGYYPQCTSGHATLAWTGQHKHVQQLLNNLKNQFPHLLTSEDFQGLLSLAALDGCSHPVSQEVKESIFVHAGKMPTFRCQFGYTNHFCITAEDNIESTWQKTVMLPECADLKSDIEINSLIAYQETFFSKDTIASQLTISRHEYFNHRLPVFNLVLDFDLKVLQAERTLDTLYTLCTELRNEILDTLEILGPVDKAAHKVFFFKSACPPIQWQYDDCMPPFCTCYPKIGLRIVCALPQDIAVIGSTPLIELVQILNRLVRMNAVLRTHFPEILQSGGPFDTGIYATGRCVRLPHTYKIDEGGVPHRLLKLFVCHPYSRNKSEYMQEALLLKNLLHHSGPSCTTAIISVSDNNCNFLSDKTYERIPQNPPDITRWVESCSSVSLEEWVSKSAWPIVLANIQQYLPDDKVSQFTHITFAYNSNIVQVKPTRGGHFRCLNFNHKSKSVNVRVFLVFYPKDESATVTLMSQCFANKCNNNKAKAHLSVQVPRPRAPPCTENTSALWHKT